MSDSLTPTTRREGKMVLDRMRSDLERVEVAENSRISDAPDGDGPPSTRPLLRRPKQLKTWATEASAAWAHSPPALASRSPTAEQSNLNLVDQCCCRTCTVIDPKTSSWLHMWDVLHALQLVAISLVWPYEMAFLERQVGLVFVFNRLCDITMACDMVMQFFIAYPDPLRPERSVRVPSAIRWNYLRGWFVPDLLSVLPVDVLCLLLVDGTGNMGIMKAVKHLRMLRYIRVVRLVRLARFVTLVERWNTAFGISNARIALLKLFTTLVLCCHWMACLWGGLITSLQEEGNWLHALRAAKGGPEFPDDDHFSIYSLAIYWAIITITSIGYGDITPQTMTEYRVATLCSSIMAAIWAYVIGAICGIVSTFDQHEIAFKRTMDDLNWFMDDKEMPPPMRQRLRRYFYEAKEMNKQKIQHTIIDNMSPLLQGEVSMFMHQRWISKVWYLRDMNREIIVWAARNLAFTVFAPNEEVLGERTLFMVQRGVCAYKGKILVSGDIWGEDMLLSNPLLRESSKARALCHLAVLTLHIADIFEVVICFSEARARLRWAQIQIALCRGIVRVATKLKAFNSKTGLSQWDMTPYQRAVLYREILQSGEEPHPQALFDYSEKKSQQSLGSSEATTLALIAATPTEAALVSGAMTTPSRVVALRARSTLGDASGGESKDTRQVLMELTASVQELKDELQFRSSSQHSMPTMVASPTMRDRGIRPMLSEVDRLAAVDLAPKPGEARKNKHFWFPGLKSRGMTSDRN